MAYTATVTAMAYNHGKATFIIQVSEVEAAAASQWSTSGVITSANFPMAGTITYQAKLTSVGVGTGVTIQPRLGKITGWSDDTADDIDGSGTASAYISEGTPVPFRFRPGQTRVLFGNAQVNAGSDNAVTWLITVQEL